MAKLQEFIKSPGRLKDALHTHTTIRRTNPMETVDKNGGWSSVYFQKIFCKNFLHSLIVYDWG